MWVIIYNDAIIIFKLVLANAEAKGSTDPETVGGRGDDHPGVGAAFVRAGGQLVLKRLFEEFIGGGLHQLNQIRAEGVAVFRKEASNERQTQLEHCRGLAQE